MVQNKSDREKAAAIVRDAGGQIVGRTRFQKIAFLLELAGLGEGFQFEYKHYGPYSEELAAAISSAAILGLVQVEDREASWGGWYSIYTSTDKSADIVNQQRQTLAHEATKIGAVELELAATAAYLNAFEGLQDAWTETARRKPEKASQERLARAKEAYRRLLLIETPEKLPAII